MLRPGYRSSGAFGGHHFPRRERVAALLGVNHVLDACHFICFGHHNKDESGSIWNQFSGKKNLERWKQVFEGRQSKGVGQLSRAIGVVSSDWHVDRRLVPCPPPPTRAWRRTVAGGCAVRVLPGHEGRPALHVIPQVAHGEPEGGRG